MSGIATSRFQNRQMASVAVCATGNRPKLAQHRHVGSACAHTKNRPKELPLELPSLDTVQGPGSIPDGGGSFGSSSVWDQPTPPYASGCFGNLPSMVCVYKSLKNAIHKQPSGQRSSFPSLFATSLPLSIHPSVSPTGCLADTFCCSCTVGCSGCFLACSHAAPCYRASTHRHQG